MQPRPARVPANKDIPFHRAGHSINHHPEDEPYTTDEKKTAVVDETYGYPDYPLVPRRSRTSAYYVPTTDKQQVIRQGNREFVIQAGPPRRRMHWLLIVWISFLVMAIIYLLWIWGSQWWTGHQLYATYGFPRTYQIDAVVGHNDSPDRPTHFIFLNLSAHVIIIELPGGDPSKARIYSGPIIFDDNPTSTPVTGEFRDLGNGRLDMIVYIGHSQIIYLNDGTQFKPKQ